MTTKRQLELMNRFFETTSYDVETDWRSVSLPEDELEDEGEGGSLPVTGLKFHVVNFNPTQPRDERGRFAAMPGGSSSDTEGGGGEALNETSLSSEVALERIRQASPAQSESGGVIENSIEVPFTTLLDRSDYSPGSKEFREAQKNAAETTVSLNELGATESWVYRDDLEKIVADFDEEQYALSPAGHRKLPRVVSHSGKLYIHDGHHRLSALSFLGKEQAQVALIRM